MVIIISKQRHFVNIKAQIDHQQPEEPSEDCSSLKQLHRDGAVNLLQSVPVRAFSGSSSGKLTHVFKFKQWLKLSHSLEVLQTNTYCARDNQTSLVQVAARNLPAFSKSTRYPLILLQWFLCNSKTQPYPIRTPHSKPQCEKSTL